MKGETETTTIGLWPVMVPSGGPEWPGARWVGAVDALALASAREIRLHAAEGYRHARLLVREGASVRGFVDTDVSDERIDPVRLRAAVGQLSPATRQQPRPTGAAMPSITVVICTRDRPEMLRQVLPTVLQLEYPDFDVLVVDNASSTSAARDVVKHEFADAPVCVIEEPLAGLSRARNTGLRHARGEIVAFTDDDVAADRWWLQEIAGSFMRDPHVDCVTGLVPSGELRARVQGFFDDRTSWSKNLQPRIFSLAAPPRDLPLFPFCVGEYGTGANFAVRRHAAIALGGFDTALGAGTRAGGGEDLDFFTRLILDGRTLALQPSAVIWHRHRDDLPALRAQAVTYGSGLGAWITKIITTPRSVRRALACSPRALVRLAAFPWRTPEVSVVRHDEGVSNLDRDIGRVGWLELLSVARGPWRYTRQRWENTRIRPATERPTVNLP